MDCRTQENQQQRGRDPLNFYGILDVPCQATADDIKRAFRRGATRYHPEKGGNDEYFKKIKEAYEVLNDPEKRRYYDEHGEVHRAEDPSDFWNFFSERGEPGKNLGNVLISLEDIYNGRTITKRETIMTKCQPCDGKGFTGVTTCQKCRNEPILIQLSTGVQARIICDLCRGRGITNERANKCGQCRDGKIESIGNYEFRIEPGAETGDKVYGLNREVNDAPPVYIKVEVEKHPVFTRNQSDIETQMKLSLVDALAGGIFRINGINGDEIAFEIREGDVIHPNEERVLKNYGLPKKNSPGAFGDLVIVFEVEFPGKGLISPEMAQGIRRLFNHMESKSLFEKPKGKIEKLWERERGMEEQKNQENEQEERYQNVDCKTQ